MVRYKKNMLSSAESIVQILDEIVMCHSRLLEAANGLRRELDEGELSPTLFRCRYEMAIAARKNLGATQRVWRLLEEEFPDVGNRMPGYRQLRVAENDLHVSYASHIATWTVAAICADFEGFSVTKMRFLADLQKHIEALKEELLSPAYAMTASAR